MNKQDLENFAKQAVKNIKTEDDLNDFRAMLTKELLKPHEMQSLMIILVILNIRNQIMTIIVMVILQRNLKPIVLNLI